MKAKLNSAYLGFPAGTVIDGVGIMGNHNLMGKCTILSLNDEPEVAQGTKGAVITTIAGGVFTAPDGDPFCLSNESADDSTVALSVVFADDVTNTQVSKRFKSGDNAYVLKSFTMPAPAVPLFYLQAGTISSAITQNTTYFVATNGSNSNAGTFASPFLTIQKGLDVAVAGDSVLVKAGTYQEYVTFNKSGTLGHPIVLKNYGADVVTIDAQSTRVYCLYAVDKKNLLIDGIKIKDSTGYNVKFSGCENVIARNITSDLALESQAINAIINSSATNWGKGITLQNINATGGKYGISLGARLDGIYITLGQCNYASIDGINSTIGASVAPSDYIKNLIIDGVVTSYNTRQGMVVYGGIKTATFRNFWSHHNGATGLQIENKSSDILIENFICENNALEGGYETGLWIDDSDGVTVRRGIMRYNQCGFRVSNSNNVLAYNLLIYSNNYTKIAGDVTNNSSGICFYSNPIGTTDNLYQSNVRLYNSVIYNNSNVYSQRGSVDIEGLGIYILKNNIIANDQSVRDIYRTGTHTLISDNNLIYNTRAISVYYSPTGGYAAPTTWAAYKSATGEDAHSINADPVFIDAANGDLRISSSSLAINSGADVGIKTDYLGYAISGTPDIGAYEYRS